MSSMNTKDGVGQTGKKGGTYQAVRTVELSRLVDAVPPHAIEAEMSLLGSMIFDPRTIADVVSIVKAGRDFHRPAHGTCTITNQ